MKKIMIAAAVTMAATSASAIELGTTGVNLGATVDANYTTGIEEYAVEFTPRAGFNKWGVGFGVETTFDVMNLNDADPFQGLDFDAEYAIGITGLKAYGEIGTDKDFEFGDATVGVKFSF